MEKQAYEVKVTEREVTRQEAKDLAAQGETIGYSHGHWYLYVYNSEKAAK